MNTEERKYRFSEIMSTVSLLPEVDMNDTGDGAEASQEWLLPNLTKHVSDRKIGDAILCQAFREDMQFKFKLVALLCNSALHNINESSDDTPPSEDDMNALALSANLLWGAGQTVSLFGLLGMIGTICARFNLKVPELTKAFLIGNTNIDKFGKLDPIALLEGNVSKQDVRDTISQDDSE